MAENDILELMKQGDAYRKNKEYGKAIDVYTKVIGIDPQYKGVYCNRGIAYYYRENYDEAIADFTKAIEIDSKDWIAYYFRGLLYSIKSMFDQAIEDYTDVINIHPKIKETYNSRGSAYFNQGKYDQAIEDYTDAIDIDPKFKEAYNSRGNAYYNQGKYEEAITDYIKAIGIDSEYKEAYNNRGNAYYNQGKYEEAIADYIKAIGIDSEYKEAYNNRGNAYYNQGKYEEAIADYIKAIGIDSQYKEAYKNTGVALWVQGKYEEAISEFTKAIKIDSEYKEAYYNRGNAYWWQEKYEEAIADYTKAISLYENFVWLYYNRGFGYEKLKKYDEAIEDYTKALGIDCKHERTYTNLKSTYKKLYKEHEKYPKEYFECTVKFYDKKFYDYIEKIEKNDTVKIKIYKLYAAVTELKNMQRHSDFKEVGHYTKISNLKYLIKPKKNEYQKSENDEKESKEQKEGRLRINNVAYMNDPTEGEAFIQLLKQYSDDNVQGLIDGLYTNKKDSKEHNREVLSGKNHVFLASFSSAIDTSLPLWVQYSENGEGCCLVFKESFFDKEDRTSLSCSLNCELGQTSEMFAADTGEKSISKKEEEKPSYCLYKVKYVKGENDSYELDSEDEKGKVKLSELIKEIGEQLMGFEEDLKKENEQSISENSESSEKKNKSDIRGIIQNILDQVRFLFKDKNYEHEEEVRLVKFEDNGNVQYTSDTEGFRVPHVYIELEKEMKLKEVILGPKVQNAAEIANYLYYTEKVDEVSKSKIKYK